MHRWEYENHSIPKTNKNKQNKTKKTEEEEEWSGEGVVLASQTVFEQRRVCFIALNALIHRLLGSLILT